VNRAERRFAGQRGGAHEMYVFPLEVAMFENAAQPTPGLSSVLDEILYRFGMDVSIGLCRDCTDIEVFG
jgi:hypothetical protein